MDSDRLLSSPLPTLTESEASSESEGSCYAVSITSTPEISRRSSPVTSPATSRPITPPEDDVFLAPPKTPIKPPPAPIKTSPYHVVHPRLLNTPLAKSEGSSRAGRLDDPKAQALYEELAADIKTHCVGPMPVKEFLGFLPAVKGPKNWRLDRFDSVPVTAIKEEEIYGPLAEALNESRCAPGLDFVVTATMSEDAGRKGSIKPDMCAYPTSVQSDVYRHTPEGSPFTHLSYADLIIEVKTNDDPFQDTSDTVPGAGLAFLAEFKGDDRQKRINRSLGQLTRYALLTFARQQRWACFQLFVVGRRARFLRWDRSGAIISRKFDYIEHPKTLCEFFWRYTHAQSRARGYDDTVRPASPTEERIFKDAIKARLIRDAPFLANFGNVTNLEGEEEPAPYLPPKKLAKETLSTHYVEGQVSSVTVEDTTYLISCPVVTPLAMVGRGTRGYWAVDTNDHKVVFLKDTWRHHVEGVDLESTNLGKLAKGGMENVSHLLKDEDVQGQNTVTAHYAEKGWSCTKAHEKYRPTPRIHYRMVTKEAGYPMSYIRGSYEVFTSTLCIVQVIIQVFLILGLIHRDISLNNIILMPNYDTPEYKVYKAALISRDGQAIEKAMVFMAFKAILIDWELMVDAKKEEPRKYVMTGTWQHIASNLLQRNGDPHTVMHDIESTFWVVLMVGLRWLPHSSVTPDTLYGIISDIFDEVKMLQDPRSRDRDVPCGGSNKAMEIHMNLYTRPIAFPDAFSKWFTGVKILIAPTLSLRPPGVTHEHVYKLLPDDLQAFVKLWEEAVTGFLKETPLCDRTHHGIQEPPSKTVQEERVPTTIKSTVSLNEAHKSSSTSSLGKRKTPNAKEQQDNDDNDRSHSRQRKSMVRNPDQAPEPREGSESVEARQDTTDAEQVPRRTRSRTSTRRSSRTTSRGN